MENRGRAMAEVATLIQVTKSILYSLHTESLSGHKAQKLQYPVSRICQMLIAVEKDLMLTAEKDKRTTDGRFETLKFWVRDVSEAVCKASELVDEAAAGSTASSFVSKFNCRSLFGNSWILGPKINRLHSSLTELESADVSMFNEAEHETSTAKYFPWMTSPLGDTVGIVGRDEDKENIVGMVSVVGRDKEKEFFVDRLLDTSDPDQHISVIAITGVGGIGKTTLAKWVYNDERITNHFDLKLWVCVGTEFDLTQILRAIINSCSAASSRAAGLALEQLLGLLKTIFSGKLFLLVLDDVWNESFEWLYLKSLLMVGARGSKILLATRSQEVATTFEAEIVHILRGLTDQESWALFAKNAFDQPEVITEELILVGIEIVRHCRGLPSSVAVVASSLRGKSLLEWQKAVDTLKQTSNLDVILEQSYINLSPSLKACFAYCSLFPKDYGINNRDLVSLWMAQGFLEPEDSRDVEDVAEEYCLGLCNDLFFTDVEKDEYGSIVKFRMHDLMHDLALHVAGGWGTMIQHMSIYERENNLPERISRMDEYILQTFLCWISPANGYEGGGMNRIKDIMENSCFKSLRVLDLHAFDIEMLPDSIGNLFHLRYLDLSHNKSLQKLPNSIANLHHLQTLKLDFCYELKELPNNFGKLVCLRRLELNGCEKLTFMPPGIENLSSLRTLSRYLVGKPRFRPASGLKSLGNLNHLRGRLMIEFSENWITSVNEAANSNLSNKCRLTELKIKWEPTGCNDTVQHQQLLDGLQPPCGLKGLQIEGYKGYDFPSWAKGNELATALPNLITVNIDGCLQCETLPPFSCLQHLKRLSLRFMNKVQFFENSDNLSSTSMSLFFPSLEELTLNSLYNLEGWWKEEMQTRSVSFSCLKKLKIWSCPKLKSMPLFPWVEVLDMQNINEKLLEFHNDMTRLDLPSSSRSADISRRENSKSLQYLDALHIKACPRLRTLVFMESSKRLRKLVVERLDVLSSLNEVLKQLSFLEELEIAACKDLDLSSGCQRISGVREESDIPWKNLSKLNSLTLRELPKLLNLPVGLMFTKTLRTLCISTCNSLSALPECIHNLTSLQHLKLERCPAVTMLPEGLKDIDSLLTISIIECPQLMERCQDGGADWHKIKHAQVFCHKSWRYALTYDAENLEKRKYHGKNIVVHSEDPTIHVDVTVRR